MRLLGKILVPVMLIGGTAYAGGEAQRYMEQESFDSIGEMVLEAGRARESVREVTPASKLDEKADCEAKREALRVRLNSLDELLAMSKKQALALQSHATETDMLAKREAYKKALKKLERVLEKAEARREAVKDAFGRYREVVAEQHDELVSEAAAAAIADVTAAMEAADAALRGIKQ